ncbi:hypothetical protein BU24DRAFT_380475, partial [Aaosphaeria arxii CBS 175.79]
METQQQQQQQQPLPPIQVQVTDSNRPTKRRRPALSCVECRRRKVKCDRQRPCGPCVRTKSESCTYKTLPPKRGEVSGNREACAGSAGDEGVDMFSGGGGHGVRSFGGLGPRELDGTVNSYTVQDGDGASMLGRGDGGFASQPASSSLPLPADALNMQALADKIRDLEGKLHSLTNSPPPSTTTTTTTAGVKSGERMATAFSSHHPTPVTPNGQFVKSKFFGESHWVNCIEPYEALGKSFTNVNPQSNRTEVNTSSELYYALLECKRLARLIKGARLAVVQPSVSDLPSTLPPKDVCDKLVKGYLRTFESIFRVLHIPTFLEEYEKFWEDRSAAKPSVLMKVILVCAIGVPFYTGEDKGRLRAACTKWIQAAEGWLNGPHGKSRLNLTGVQIHILLLQARQMCCVDGDLIWISAGALLRSAMHLGLHREPTQFPKISAFHVEMRRRLWATILELTVQMSLDIGMPPTLSEDDYDTLPPSNLNDDQMDDTTTELPATHPWTTGICTDTTLQLMLLDSLPLRLRITRRINSIRTQLSYAETLRLGTTLMNICRSNLEHLLSLQAAILTDSSTSRPSPFTIKLIDIFVRRFVLALHRPFFGRAVDEPEYHYSRKICLDTSFMLIAPPSAAPAPAPSSVPSHPRTADEVGNVEEEGRDDYTNHLHHAVGFQKWCLLYSISTIYLEMVNLIHEFQSSPYPPATTSSSILTTSASSPSPTGVPEQIRTLLSHIRASS